MHGHNVNHSELKRAFKLNLWSYFQIQFRTFSNGSSSMLFNKDQLILALRDEIEEVFYSDMICRLQR
ncbi:unnamed protein product [Paramecium octaurelia]|uniref:Uncharacterized protein n=1 Tax=Paramecium octaurelia TaxID=43137 RepID=A0A8S1XZ20_PAROT|nr:unnamed protein product [Paramecium octaurelia]